MTNEFIKKICFLTIHFGLAQLILLLATPLLTRLYTPDNFASFGYITAFISIFLPLTSLQFEYAIPLSKIQKITNLLVKMCLLLVCSMGILIFAIFIFLQSYFSLTKIDVISSALFFIIFLLQGLVQVYTLSLNTEGKIRVIAQGRIIQNCVMVAVQIMLPISFYTHCSNELLIGLLLGLLSNLIYYYKLSFFKLSTINVNLSKRKIVFLFKRYYKLPLFSSWSAFVESSSTLMPILLIGPFYGAKWLGIYFLVYRVFTAPSGLLTNALSRLLIKEFSDCIKEKITITPLFFKVSKLLASLAVVYLLIMILISPYMPCIFGSSWVDAEPVLKVLSPIIAIMLCVSPLSAIFLFLNKNGIDLIWQLMYVTLTFWVIYYFHQQPFMYMLILLVVVWSLLYSIYWLMMMKIIFSWDKKLCVA